MQYIKIHLNISKCFKNTERPVLFLMSIHLNISVYNLKLNLFYLNYYISLIRYLLGVCYICLCTCIRLTNLRVMVFVLNVLISYLGKTEIIWRLYIFQH